MTKTYSKSTFLFFNLVFPKFKDSCEIGFEHNVSHHQLDCFVSNCVKISYNMHKHDNVYTICYKQYITEGKVCNSTLAGIAVQCILQLYHTLTEQHGETSFFSGEISFHLCH